MSQTETTPSRTAGPAADAALAERIRRLIENVNSIFVGPQEVVRLTVAALLSRGHLLIEDVPGIGKTLLGVVLARSVKASFHRVQFTNDLLPSDILGLSIFNQKEHAFDFKPGPIFSNVVLADEINRSTPKTQSALLEAMNDLQVSIDGKTHPLPPLFMVIATQNPVEYHGTYPLPEAQLDRFLMRVRIGYPAPTDEKRILREKDLNARIQSLKPVLTIEETLDLQKKADEVRVDEAILDYVVKIAEATRGAKIVKLGLSPRGALAVVRAARAVALMEGRGYCVPDDVKAVAVPVIGHRLILDTSLYGVAKIEEVEATVASLMRSVPSPD